MKISYDPKVDALYIRLIDGEHECLTRRLNEGVALNMGLEEMLVGIEILDASRVLGEGEMPVVELENVRVAAAAATES